MDQNKLTLATIVGKLAIGQEIVQRSPTSRTALTVLTGRVLMECRVRDQTKSWKTNFSGEKVNRNGQAFEWCKQCGCYTTTHNTQTHTKKAQKGLIAKIINVTGMQGCNPNHVPATQVALGSNPEGDMMKEVWSYSSVISMLLYLLTNTRPDITFAVLQVAHFSSAPKQSHATAVKMIVRYLSATKDQGTIM